MNEANEPIRRDLFRKAQASDDEAGLAKVHSFCIDMQRSLGGDMASDYTKTMVRSCTIMGYL